jgi:hypothetical protein
MFHRDLISRENIQIGGLANFSGHSQNSIVAPVPSQKGVMAEVPIFDFLLLIEDGAPRRVSCQHPPGAPPSDLGLILPLAIPSLVSGAHFIPLFFHSTPILPLSLPGPSLIVTHARPL